MMMHDVGVMGMRPEDPFSTFSCEPVAGFSYTWAPLVLFFFFLSLRDSLAPTLADVVGPPAATTRGKVRLGCFSVEQSR